VEELDFITAWYLYQLIPIVLSGVFVAVGLAAGVYKSIKAGKLQLPIRVMTACLLAWVALLNIMIIGFVSSALEVFSCRNLGGKQVSSADIGIDCFEFGERYKELLGWARFSAAFYGAGIGGLFLIILLVNTRPIKANIRLLALGHTIETAVKNAFPMHIQLSKEKLATLRHTHKLVSVHLLFGAMYKAFRAEYYWCTWLVVILGHKFALTFAATVFRSQVGVSVTLIGI